MTDCSLAGQPYFSYVHACVYDKWAGGIRKKGGQLPLLPPWLRHCFVPISSVFYPCSHAVLHGTYFAVTQQQHIGNFLPLPSNNEANLGLREGCGLLKSRLVMRGDQRLTKLLHFLNWGAFDHASYTAYRTSIQLYWLHYTSACCRKQREISHNRTRTVHS